jgi:hypothetical protein
MVARRGLGEARDDGGNQPEEWVMAERMKGLLPLATAVALVAFVYVEVTLNFTFHWVTDGDLGNGLSLPASFHFVVPAGFVAWAMFFALGGDREAIRRVSSRCGVASARLAGVLTPKPAAARAPDSGGAAPAH